MKSAAATAKRVLTNVILSVCPSVRLSVCLIPPATDSSPGEIQPRCICMISFAVNRDAVMLAYSSRHDRTIVHIHYQDAVFVVVVTNGFHSIVVKPLHASSPLQCA